MDLNIAAQATTEAIVGVQFAHEVHVTEGPSSAAPRKSRSHRPRNGSSPLQASYDSSATTSENWRHWAHSDHKSADSSLTASIRKTTRSRARYEVLRNNPIGLGICLTLANDTIGTGPRLHLGYKNETYNQRVQASWTEWAMAINLAEKLHTSKMAKTIDGESMGRITVNPRLEAPVTLDYRLFECDRVESPYSSLKEPRNYVDGIHFDEYDNATAYDILRDHPGSSNYAFSQTNFQTYDSRNIIHWFRRDRPEQHRGISEVQSALALFAYLRRFTLATVGAAETAANLSLVLKTNSPAPTEYQDEHAELMHDFWMDSIQLDRNAATILPNEWELAQVMAQHPATTYAMFKQELISEISRALCMPYNVAAANSADHNYASGRLDHQTYHHAITVERTRIARTILDRLFNEWLHEAALIGGVLPGRVAARVLAIVDRYGSHALSRMTPHTWHWDGFSHSDPEKEARAQGERLANGISHRRLEYAREGRDIDVEDLAAASDYGMTLLEYQNMMADAIFYNGNKMAKPLGAEGTPNNPTSLKKPDSANESDRSDAEDDTSEAMAAIRGMISRVKQSNQIFIP